jgi:hypothetical protein
MQIHSFGTKHAFIHRVIFISFYGNTSLRIFVNNNATTYTTITASCVQAVIVICNPVY